MLITYNPTKQERKLNLNKNQIGDIEHALRNGNRFYTDSNDKDWNDLVNKGYASKHPGWDERSAYFRVTAEGEQVLKKLLVK